MSGNSFDKQVREKLVIAVDYSNELPSGVTVSSGVVEAKDSSGNLAAVLASATATTTSTTAKCTVQDGQSGGEYVVTFLTTLSDGQVWEDEVVMRVRNR